jgi:hypothetical protein
MFGTIYSGQEFLSYWILIPQNNDLSTSVWIYHFNSQTWTNIQVDDAVRALENIAIA